MGYTESELHAIGYAEGLKDARTGRCLTPDSRMGYHPAWLVGYDDGQESES